MEAITGCEGVLYEGGVAGCGVQWNVTSLDDSYGLNVRPFDAARLLPDSVARTQESELLQLRSCSVASPVNDSTHLTGFIAIAQAVVRSTDPELFDRVDEVSWINMAEALQFAGVDSLEKAMQMELRLCPPAPVFHTWAALHGTTIFDGKNNPSHFERLNYVQRIIEEADALEKYGIPLLIFFSDRGLSQQQIQSMKAEFSDHPNILCLSFESDLQLELSPELKSCGLDVDFWFSDSLRIVISQHIEQVLDFCFKNALENGKEALANRIETLGKKHIFYSDIDNQWLQKPPFILARKGVFTLPMLSSHMSFVNLLPRHFSLLSAEETELLKKHRAFFDSMPYFNKTDSSAWTMEKAIMAYEYIRSGEAECNQKYLANAIQRSSGAECDCLVMRAPWNGDNGCIYASTDSAAFFFECALNKVISIDLHQDPKHCYEYNGHRLGNPDPYFREAHSLIGMQLLRYFTFGHDRSWVLE